VEVDPVIRVSWYKIVLRVKIFIILFFFSFTGKKKSENFIPEEKKKVCVR